MAAPPVAHLHNHTTHSTRDGLQKLDAMCAAVRSDYELERAAGWSGAGDPAVAVTDHGNLSASWKFAAAADRAGVKPIIGEEIYLAHGSRFDRDTVEAVGDDESGAGGGDTDVDKATGKKMSRYFHLTVLASEPVGWENLCWVSSEANDPEAFWSKPRADFDLLDGRTDGLIVLTGCLGGPVAGPLAAGDRARAEANLARLVDLVGETSRDPEKSRLFVEIMDHDFPTESRVLPELLDLADRFGLPVAATNDAHYTDPAEHDAHDAWLCVGSDSRLDTPGRWRFPGTGYHMRSTAEMRALFDREDRTAQAVTNTWRIAQQVDPKVLPGARLRLPTFTLPDGTAPPEGSDRYLFDLVKAGAVARYSTDGTALPDQVRRRLQFEYTTIKTMGLSDYFLIVWDLVTWARSEGIRVGAGRGSAAGCAISYCLGIVTIDPVAHGLLFERFLNPERVGMPDIDTDFEKAAVPRVVEYLRQRWGSDRVARIGSLGYLYPPGALRMASKVLAQGGLGGRLADKVPKGPDGKPVSFAALDNPTNDQAAPFHTEARSTPAAAHLVEVARTFEGQVNSEGIHACGVVVSDQPLPGLVPLRRDRRKDRAPVLVTEWDGKDVDAFGLLKLDALGIRNLDVISAAVRIIRDTTGEDLDCPAGGNPAAGAFIDSPPTDPSDPRAAAAWKLIHEGVTAGLFQLEGSGMTGLARRIAPTSLDELSAVIALFRPGPLGDKMHDRYANRKAGLEPVDYSIFTTVAEEQAAIAAVLDSTFGVPCFQEQLMRLGEVVGGFGPGSRERLRKAVSKKNRAEMDAVGALFVAGAVKDRTESGDTKVVFRQTTAEKLWDAMKGAGAYAFNASHSLGYAKTAYITAYLKANWPAAFGAGLLSVTANDDKRLAVLRSLRQEGVRVAGPDVNLSAVRTSVDATGAVRIGLGEVKGVGVNAEAVVSARASGPYHGLADLLGRVTVPGEKGPQALPANIVEALIEAGALDTFGTRLGQSMALRLARSNPAAAETGAVNDEWGLEERAARERTRLGVQVSENPLKALSAQIAAWPGGPRSKARLTPLQSLGPGGSHACTVGVVARFDVERKGTRRAYLTLEGSTVSVDAIMWSDTLDRLEAAGALPEVGEIVGVDAKVREVLIRRRSAGDGSGDEDLADELDDEIAAAEEPTVAKELVVYDVWRRPLSDPPRSDRTGTRVPVRPVGGPDGSAGESVSPEPGPASVEAAA